MCGRERGRVQFYQFGKGYSFFNRKKKNSDHVLVSSNASVQNQCFVSDFVSDVVKMAALPALFGLLMAVLVTGERTFSNF